jgi:putative membrane protein
VALYATIQFCAFVLIALLISAPSVRRLLTPHGLKQRFVRQRALEQFISKGVANTSERTGVLLYVSVKDKCAELVADKGVEAKVAPATWTEIVAKLIVQIKRGRVTDGVVAAIQAAGGELALHFPPSARNPNELPDGVTELAARRGLN